MIARIIMSEHPDEKDLKLFVSDHKDAVKDGFLANTLFSISVQTSPTSLLVISEVVEVVVIPFDMSSITSGLNSVVSKLGINNKYDSAPIAKITKNNNAYLF